MEKRDKAWGIGSTDRYQIFQTGEPYSTKRKIYGKELEVKEINKNVRLLLPAIYTNPPVQFPGVLVVL
jgi:hypothetical protein